MENKIPTAEVFLKKEYNSSIEDIISGEYRDNIEFGKSLISQWLIDFAKLHVKAALQAAADSRCIKMFDQTWYAQSLEPGTKVLDRVDITVDKESILNAYPDEFIK
jgi:hypothetical protein